MALLESQPQVASTPQIHNKRVILTPLDPFWSSNDVNFSLQVSKKPKKIYKWREFCVSLDIWCDLGGQHLPPPPPSFLEIFEGGEGSFLNPPLKAETQHLILFGELRQSWHCQKVRGVVRQPVKIKVTAWASPFSAAHHNLHQANNEHFMFLWKWRPSGRMKFPLAFSRQSLFPLPQDTNFKVKVAN